MIKLKKRINIFIIIIVLAISIFLLKSTKADNNYFEINNFEDLVEASLLSKNEEHQYDTFILTNNIEITQENQDYLNNSDLNYISFGSSDVPFKGTFDGAGYYISNLKYESTYTPKADTGLFENTDGAKIKNLTIKNSDIQSDYRGGIVVGYAKNTLIENITVEDSHLFVSAINNVLTIINDGGIRGGAIVGEAENCIIYNCEAINTRVNTNNTSGVAALSGKGLSLGGLVGISISTQIEYSRVIGGLIKNYYDVAVGALGGNVLYVGGIAGQIKGSSKIIDSYSTAELNYYCATYVSVGAGNVGHIGGITGAMLGNESEIVRCHYAGKTSSTQYNAALIIPIIQNNVNISGISNIFEGGVVKKAYFKSGMNPDVNMGCLGSEDVSSDYGPITDIEYVNMEFWKNNDYDFFGNISRDTAYNNEHFNQWTMDYKLGIPIHGKNIFATLDFKGAGKVTIDSTKLISTQSSTDNPYEFAMQGINSDETTVNVYASENQGYKFDGWYKISNVSTNKIDENYDYFLKIYNENEKISNEKEINNMQIKNNDLLIAYYKTLVIFHDINGNIIDVKNGNPVKTTSDNDWYMYNSKIEKINPVNKPNSKTAKLIGWTSIKNSKEIGGGYSCITNQELEDLKGKNAFFEEGDFIKETLSLYPIYADLISNIITVFEGNEQDEINNISIRDGVGKTTVEINSEGNVIINVIGNNEDGSFPYGYKFLGWYDENNIKISKNQQYELKNIDFSAKHTFTARFEYLIEYYIKAFDQGNGNSFTSSELYESHYQTYNTNFENINAPGYIREYITHWGIEHVNHKSNDDLSDAYNKKIVSPLKVYSHNYNKSTGSINSYKMIMTTDFPNSGEIEDLTAVAGAKFRFTPNSDRYHFQFWTLERPGKGLTYINNPMSTGALLTTSEYKGMAMVTGDIVFHKKDGSSITVTRRYNNSILMSEDNSYTYKYPFYNTDQDVDIDSTDGTNQNINNVILLEASPSNEDMKVEGYSFLGWINSKEIEEGSPEWNYIYDMKDDKYCTSNIEKAKPYLMDENEVVVEICDLYPVYAKYNINTSTNIMVDSERFEINTPANPSYNIIEEENGKALIEITVDNDTYVTNENNQKYELDSLVRVYDDGTEEIIEKNEDGKYIYEIEAGLSYSFMAKYKQALVIYHLNNDETSVEIKQIGDTIGEMLKPNYKLEEKYIFYGWSNYNLNNSEYYILNSTDELENYNIITQSTIVYESMELRPIYIKVQISINSNIDVYLENNNFNLEDIRFYKKNSVDNLKLEARDSIDNYKFIGWYKNYVSQANKGELITTSNSFILQRDDCLENILYTAVYEKVYKINYYDTKGNIIYTANVEQENSRSFVREEFDEQGNKMYVPIDVQAYQEINNHLEKNENFINWQWEKSTNTIIDWNEFFDKTIMQDMNLYPIISKVTIKNEENDEIDVLGSLEKEPDILISWNKQDAQLIFNIEYFMKNLKIHIEKISYNSSKNATIEFMNNINVTLLNNKESQETIITDKTDNNGDLTINLIGEVEISRKDSNNKDVYIFNILNENNEIINEILLSQGESKIVRIPYGKYKIVQKKDWAWRYFEDLGKEICITNYNEKSNILYDEERIINKWFDSMSYIN